MTPSLRLLRTEAKLFLREPVSVLFVVAFPALVVLVIGGVFESDDPTFGGAKPSDFYIAAYISVVLAAVGFIMMPVHLASYREQGVLRRFAASQFRPWQLVLAWTVAGVLLSILGMLVLAATGLASYGLPTMERPGATALAVVVVTSAYINVGLFLGLLVRGARAAQSVGLVLFFTGFLLGGGGPPPDAMPDVMRSLSQALPTTWAVKAIQNPWLGIGSTSTVRLLLIGGISVAAAGASWRLAGSTESK